MTTTTAEVSSNMKVDLIKYGLSLGRMYREVVSKRFTMFYNNNDEVNNSKL